MAPVMSPLGFDWRMNVCILTGLPAKEAIVSTMAILYHEPTEVLEEAENSALAATLKKNEVFTPTTAFGFMMFVLLYFPCIATIAAIKNETGSWRWAVFAAGYTTLVAWIVSAAVYQIGSLF